MNQKQIWQIARESSIVKPVRSIPENLDAQLRCAKLLDCDNTRENPESSMCPRYSNMQLRTIRRLQINQAKYGHGNVKRLSRHRAFNAKMHSPIYWIQHRGDISMTQEIDEDYVSLMRATMEKWYSEPREGKHVSDVTMCPRQKVFREIHPIPLTDKDLNVYSSGRAVHEAVQFLFRSIRNRFEIEKYVEYKDIEGSVDIYDKKKNIPIEFKTVRSNNIDRPREFHLEQYGILN